MIEQKRILVACIGNIFLGDDAFGVHVAQRLMECHFPSSVKIVDFGIRGLDLVYALLENWHAAILVDAAPRGGKPGSLYIIEPEMPDLPDTAPQENLMEGHSMDPVKVLQMAREMGGTLGRILLVGCEPTPIDPDGEMQMELSPRVAAAIDPAVSAIGALIADIMSDSSLPLMEVQHVPQYNGPFEGAFGPGARAN
jgi:hydrogenase maturation protease